VGNHEPQQRLALKGRGFNRATTPVSKFLYADLTVLIRVLICELSASVQDLR
jgi:hypothetical protein